ncbi:MAG: cytochrome c [Nitrospirae bacterium]|nr:cytochrome c [Nitrospirota bacterium]
MPVFLLKSILSILLLVLTFISMFTMFEIFGRTEKKYNIEKLKKIHKVNGIVYLFLFIFISYFCIDFIINTKAELSARATFHSIFVLTIIVLFGLKLSFIRMYRQYYVKVQTIGLLIAVITFLMVGMSGGYYLLITRFGAEKFPERIERLKATEEKIKIVVRTDSASIKKGEELYNSKCYFCHDAYSTKVIVGPEHKGILRNPFLPVSKEPATPENIANQIRHPYRDMPSFAYLADEQVQDVIAFLNTL